MQAAGDWTLHPWLYNYVGGVTVGQARHNSSNVGGVTAVQVGHNSTVGNTGSGRHPNMLEQSRKHSIITFESILIKFVNMGGFKTSTCIGFQTHEEPR